MKRVTANKGENVDFVDLHLHSTYSNLDGFGMPDQIVARAKEIDRKSIALTDHGSISGFVKHRKACVDHGLKPIYGCEFYVVDSLEQMFANKEQRKKHITVLAKDLEGYHNLLELATLSFSKGFYYKQTIDINMLFEHNKGLIVGSGCWNSFLQDCLKSSDIARAERLANSFKDVFGDRYFLEVQHFKLFTETMEAMKRVHDATKIPIVLTCDPHYLYENQSHIQEILHAIRDKRSFDETQVIEGAFQWPADTLFTTVSELMPAFDWKQVFDNTCGFADMCNVDMPFGDVPRFIDEQNRPTIDVFKEMLKQGIVDRGLKLEGVVKERLQKEVQLIQSKDFVDYFVIVADMIRWAKDHDIYVGPARGSSAGSLVCYCLGITEINPLQFDLIFERFIDENRTDLPDIDIDFESSRRDEVKAYLYSKYGYDRVCSIATFTQFKQRNTLDDVGKVYDIDKELIKEAKKFASVNEMSESFRSRLPKEIDYVEVLDGQLRHMGQHAAGVLIGDRPLKELIAIYTRDGENLASVEMGDASELGLVKIDVLAVSELSVIRDIAEEVGMSMRDVYDIKIDDEHTLNGFKEIDVEGVFQFNGYATKNVLKQLRQVDFEKLIACTALSKPGPFYGGGTASYIASENGDKTKDFNWHPVLDRITRATNGQIVYQEQVLQIIREVAGMSWEEANKVRGVISKSKGDEAFAKYWDSFRDGAIGNGLSNQQAQLVWDNIKKMGGYAFNKSHAVSYALLAWWSMYFKRHYPLAFYCASLNKEEDKNLIREIKGKNIKVLKPFLGKSGMGWSADGNDAIRAGLTSIHGIGDKVAHALITNDYSSAKDFYTKKARGVTSKTLSVLKDAEAIEDDGYVPPEKTSTARQNSKKMQMKFDF